MAAWAGVKRAFGKVAEFGRSHPVIFGCGVSMAKTGGSDCFAQLYVEKREHLDWKRNAVFCTWGLMYLGGVQYFLYVKLFTQRLFPGAAAFTAKPLREKLVDTAGQKLVLKQVFLDQAIHHPFMLFPAFYQVKEFIEGGTPADAWRKFRKNQIEDLKVCWSIWVPAFLVNFSFCPIWMRIPFVACISIGFTIVLSCMRGSQEVLEPELADLPHGAHLEDHHHHHHVEALTE